jgi:hypothetical protein|tara:strand:- start:749 stop:1456 length:708 start_codon:yes stop_codon:yes gene_type:complete
MLNIFATLVATSLAAHAPSPDFHKPVNVSQEETKYENLINLSTSLDIPEFRQISDNEVSYKELKYEAMHNCKNNDNPSTKVIDTLIKVEQLFDPPPSVKGMVLAAACMESGFNPLAKGDRKFSKSKKVPMAIGVLQQWPVYEKRYGTDRTDPESAALSWMGHIVKQISKVKKQCKYTTNRKIWVAAWVTGIRYKKKGGRCNEFPKHYRLLKKWHRNIKRNRSAKLTCNKKGECGC